MDERNWTRTEEDNILSLDLNLTQASVLYIALKQGVVHFEWEKNEISERIKAINIQKAGNSINKENPGQSSDLGLEKELNDLKESLDIVKLILEVNDRNLKELASIIKELEPSEHEVKKSIIITPK